MSHFLAVIIGCSAGGVAALSQLFENISSDFPLPIIVVSHQLANSDGLLSNVLNYSSQIAVVDVKEKKFPHAQYIYIAPSNYHLLIEEDGSFALNVDPKVHFSRPAIDVSFESAAEFYGKGLIGIVLTGANSDGTEGTKTIKACGGKVIVQAPETAEVTTMPQSVVNAGCADYVLPIESIATKLLELINLEFKFYKNDKHRCYRINI